MIIVWLLVLVVCLFGLVKSSDWFVDSAKKIGYHFKLSPFIIGVTIVAIGTSLPELITSIFSVRNGVSEIVVGNVLGSNIANILLVIGISAVVAKRLNAKDAHTKINFGLLLVSLLMLIGVLWDGSVVLWESILFSVCGILYLIYLTEATKRIKKKSDFKYNDVRVFDFVILILSLIVLFLSSNYIIHAIIEISKYFNIGTEVIAATVISIGTSLPELSVSLTTLKKKENDMLIGNILGSNLFNTFAVIGIAGLFGSIVAPLSMVVSSLTFLIIATLLYFIIVKDNKISLREGVLMLALYVTFILRIVGVF